MIRNHLRKNISILKNEVRAKLQPLENNFPKTPEFLTLQIKAPVGSSTSSTEHISLNKLNNTRATKWLQMV